MPRGKVMVSRNKISKSQRQREHARSMVSVHHRENFVVHHLFLDDNTGNRGLTIICFLNAHNITICYRNTRAGNHNFTKEREKFTWDINQILHRQYSQHFWGRNYSYKECISPLAFL